MSEQIVTIAFDDRQISLVREKCGVDLRPIESTPVSLAMLSLLAVSAGATAMPLVGNLRVAREALADLPESTESRHFTVEIALNPAQREMLSSVVKRDWDRIILFPDEWEVRFSEDWTNVASHQLPAPFRLVVGMSEAGVSPDEVLIRVPQNSASRESFGAGGHPTTRLMLACLSKFGGLKATRVLDVGTGSGILAVAAALLGSRHIVAFDVDESAVETAKEMAELNEVSDRMSVLKTEISSIEGSFDLVFANIFPCLIRGMKSDLARVTRTGGKLLVSGMPTARRADITSVLTASGFVLLTQDTTDSWDCFVFEKI